RRGIAQILGGSGMMMQENKQKTGSFVLKNECEDELESFAQVSIFFSDENPLAVLDRLIGLSFIMMLINFCNVYLSRTKAIHW
ncbi:MAG: hypothetical protein Q4A74_08135, partial [Cardiobacteriaceae bacterium]|nr:hypothetical protein [Cardiobacteriaceae bacterium]